VNSKFDLIIWDTLDDIPLDCVNLVYWNSYGNESSRNIESIPKLVEENSNYYKSKYLAKIYEIGAQKINGKTVVDHFKIRPQLSYWWLTLISEKSNYFKSPQIENIIKLEALHDLIVTKRYKKIKLVSSNNELSGSVKLMIENLGVSFKWKNLPSKANKNQSLVRKFYNRLPYYMKSILWLIRSSIYYWPLRGVGVNAWTNSEAKLTFATYFDNVAGGLNSSKYWTVLPDLLIKNEIKSNWLHIFEKDQFTSSPIEAKKKMISFNTKHSSSQVHVFLHSFMSVRLVINVFFDWLKVIKLSKVVKTHIQKNSGFMWPLIKHDYFQSVVGPISISNLMELNLLEKAMGEVSNQERGCYLQENQPWELCFIYSWKQNNHSNSLLSIPHSTVRYWDLRYFFDSKSYFSDIECNLPMPDNVGVNGIVARTMYIEQGYPEGRLLDIEALRYLHLNLTKDSIKTNLKKHMVILILGDYMEKDTQFQMELLEASSSFLGVSFKYIVKSHPNNPIKPADYPNLSFKVSIQPISELVGECSLAYTSNVTSSALDAYCAGLPIVSAFDPAKLNRSPLRGFDDVFFVSNPGQLINAFEVKSQLQDRNWKANSFFNINPNLSQWKFFLGI